MDKALKDQLKAIEGDEGLRAGEKEGEPVNVSKKPVQVNAEQPAQIKATEVVIPKKPPPPKPAPEVNLTEDMLQRIFVKVMQEAKKPSAKEQEKENREQRFLDIRNAREETSRQLRKQTYCTHEKENGKFSISGQPTSDGFLSLVCQICNKLWTGIPLPPHVVGGGITPNMILNVPADEYIAPSNR